MAKTDRKLIAYCGLYCGDCPGHTGSIANLAGELRRELERVKFDKTAEVMSEVPSLAALAKYRECYEALGAMANLRCAEVCRKRAEAPQCEVWVCAREKGLEGCWECEECEVCTKMDFLKRNHGDANRKNLRKIKRHGIEDFLGGKRYW